MRVDARHHEHPRVDELVPAMAQKLVELANSPAVADQAFDAILQEFNDQQMSKH